MSASTTDLSQSRGSSAKDLVSDFRIAGERVVSVAEQRVLSFLQAAGFKINDTLLSVAKAAVKPKAEASAAAPEGPPAPVVGDSPVFSSRIWYAGRAQPLGAAASEQRRQ